MLRSNPCEADPRVAKEGRVIKQFADVTVLAWDRTGALPQIEETDFGTVVRYRKQSGYGSLSMLPKLLGFNLWIFWKLLWDKYDAVHACDLDTSFSATLAQLIRRKPLVHDMFDMYAEANAGGLPGPAVRVARSLEKWVVRRARATIIVDDSRRKQIADFTPKLLEVIYNSPEDIGQPSAYPANKNLEIFYTGVLALNRGFEYFIPATGQLKGVHLTIGGYGADESFIESLCKKEKNVTFIGKVPYSEVIQRSQESDVLFALYDPEVPNHKFSSPNKLFEAMMLGMPIIVSNGTGMSDIVEKTKNGLVVTYGNAAEWEEAVEQLKDDKLRTTFGKASRAAYEKEYGWPVMAERLKKLYATVI
jgi:glycosyltransferase involved in cell wall biosynthesis